MRCGVPSTDWNEMPFPRNLSAAINFENLACISTMAHSVEGAEGTETGVAKPATELSQWLKDNRLVNMQKLLC